MMDMMPSDSTDHKDGTFVTNLFRCHGIIEDFILGVANSGQGLFLDGWGYSRQSGFSPTSELDTNAGKVFPEIPTSRTG